MMKREEEREEKKVDWRKVAEKKSTDKGEKWKSKENWRRRKKRREGQIWSVESCFGMTEALEKRVSREKGWGSIIPRVSAKRRML